MARRPPTRPSSVYVPPGESRVVRVPRPKGSGLYRELRLSGDESAYDNTIYFADERREEKNVVYIGTDRADDPAGLLYYLERVFVDTPRRTIKIVPQLPSKPFQLEQPSSVPLVIVTAETGGPNARLLEQYVQNGGTVLFVVHGSGPRGDAGGHRGGDPVGPCRIKVERRDAR